MNEEAMVKVTKQYHNYGDNERMYYNFIKRLYNYRKENYGEEYNPVIVDLMDRCQDTTLEFNPNLRLRVGKREVTLRDVAADICSPEEMEAVFIHVKSTYNKQPAKVK